jgi:hypothetical protein
MCLPSRRACFDHVARATVVRFVDIGLERSSKLAKFT